MAIVGIFLALLVLSGYGECRVSKDDFEYGNYDILNITDEFSITTNETLDYNIGIPSFETFMKANETLDFLATFTPGFQQELVYQQVKNCPLTSLCIFALNVAIDELNILEEPCCAKCSCEFPECMFTRTCCIDMLLRSTNISHQTRFDEGNPQCIPLYLTQHKTMISASDRHIGAFMYASCPPGTDEQLNINCTRKYSPELAHYKDIIPVTNMLSSATFRNAYCAYCNGVKDKYLAQAQVVLTCNKNSTLDSEHDVIKAALEEETCDVEFQSTDYVTFKTCKTSIVECNVTGRWLHYNASVEMACKLYRNVIFIEDIYFNNVFCAMCNGMTVEKYTCFFSQHDSFSVSYSFSGLLKLESGGGNSKDRNSQSDCSEDQLHDYIFGKCRDLICSPLMNIKQGKCVESYSKVRNVKYTMYLRVRPLENITLFQGYLIANQLINYLYNLPLLDTPCGILLMYHVKDSICNESSDTMAFTWLSYFKVRVETSMTYLHDPYKIFEMFSMLHQSNHSIHYFNYHEKRMNVFHVQFDMSDDILSSYDHFAFLNEAEEFNDGLNHYMGDELILPFEVLIENYSYTINTSGVDIYNLRVNDFVGVCSVMLNLELNVLHLDPCPKVLISKLQVAWKQTDDGIKLIDTNMIIDNTDFYYNSSDSIVVCVEVYKEYMQKLRETSFSTKTIVSIVCSAVSLFSLIFTFIVFLVLPKLRKNLPGKNNMSLVHALICAQCLYLISGMGVFESGTPQCVAFGMLVHFSWLLSLFWMNICTYHMFHVLTKSKVISRTSGKCRFIIYHVYAITMSAILVAINVIVQMSANGSYGYGDTACYISSQKMIVYTFGIPVAVIILSNLCMYFVVVYKIGMSPSVQKNVKHERNDFLIFIKLSTLTGATWVFGLINYWADVIILSYLFILLNASQGVFIMFAFILNHRVFSMFRKDVLGHDVTFTDTETTTTKASVHTEKPMKPL